MPSEDISGAELGVLKALAQLDELHRATHPTELSIARMVASSREAIAKSRDLLDRIGREFR
jgi:hypothetical protein